MPIACPVDLNAAVLRSEVSNIYGRVAAAPDGEFHFHRGLAYAAEFLGYDREELLGLPSYCTASFAGVGNPLAIGPIQAGETVLDYWFWCRHGSVACGQASGVRWTRDWRRHDGKHG